jgi:hypothetical protein
VLKDVAIISPISKKAEFDPRDRESTINDEI